MPVRAVSGKSGNWSIEEFEITESGASLFNINCHGRPVEPGKYKQLKRGFTIVMSNTPAELRDHQWFVSCAEGDVLVAGLGLGCVLEELIARAEVKSVTVIEQSIDVYDLVAPSFKDEPKVTITLGDIFTWKPPKGRKWDYGWFDIWDNICSDNLDDMETLKRKFGKSVKKKYCWCESECKRQF